MAKEKFGNSARPHENTGRSGKIKEDVWVPALCESQCADGPCLRVEESVFKNEKVRDIIRMMDIVTFGG